MSWLEQLVQTYEESEEIVGKFGLDGMKSVLPPVGHILGDAQIEIVLNGEGELISVAADAAPLHAGFRLAYKYDGTPSSAARQAFLYRPGLREFRAEEGEEGEEREEGGGEGESA